MRRTMIQYVRNFQLHSPAIHAYVELGGLTYWHMTTLPTILFFNPKGKLIDRINGALTVEQIRSLIHELETKKSGT